MPFLYPSPVWFLTPEKVTVLIHFSDLRFCSISHFSPVSHFLSLKLHCERSRLGNCLLDTPASHSVILPKHYTCSSLSEFITVLCHPPPLPHPPAVREACSDLQPRTGRWFGWCPRPEWCDGCWVLARWYYIWSIVLYDAQPLLLPVMGHTYERGGNVRSQQALEDRQRWWAALASLKPILGIPGCSRTPSRDKEWITELLIIMHNQT